MTLIRRSLSLLLTTTLFTGSYGLAATSEQAVRQTSPQALILTVHGEDPSTADVAINIQTKPLESDAADVATRAINQELSGNTALTIVSADDDETLSQLAEEPSIRANSNRLAFIKGSQLAQLTIQAGQKTKAFAHDYKGYVHDALHTDALGLMILTYGVGTDSVRWIHMSHMSTFVKTSNVAFGIASALIFSVNGKLWTRYTRPIQQKIRDVLHLPDAAPGHGLNMTDVGVQFLSSWLLSAVINVGRIPLIIEAAPSNADKISTYAIPIMTSLIGTASGFAWSELYGSVDSKTAPKTYRSLMWTKNLRNVLLASFASTAMLLNYGKYGLGPWIDVAVSGGLGMALYYNAARIKSRLDPKTNPPASSHARMCRDVVAD